MSTQHTKTPRRLNSFRALRRIFRLEKALEWQKRQTEGAWFNRNHYCKEINIIGMEILSPRMNGAFASGNCSPEAVTRETRNLIERLEAEIHELRAALRKAQPEKV